MQPREAFEDMESVAGLRYKRRAQSKEEIKLSERTDPTAGVTYAWRNLNVYAGGKGLFKKPRTHILNNVSGMCEGGQLLAIMGASGAGKTTLLNVLTFRSSKLEITGDIHVNGRPVSMRTIAGISAYVQQEDLFTGVFTVEEQLHFNAQLRIGKEVSAEERKSRVAEVIKEVKNFFLNIYPHLYCPTRQLGLGKCAGTRIGIPGLIKGISGGEKKRLAIACEMITNPLLLLCDEPTSGLDSFMAQSVVRAMKRLTDLGKTVIATIHQPSSEVFAMFDRLLILAEGRVAFLGTVDQAHVFFTRMERPCPTNYNPGDHFISVLAIRGGVEQEGRKFISHVCDSYRNSEGQDMDEQIQMAMKPPGENDALANIELPKSPYRASWANQFAAMMRRSIIEVIRNPVLTLIKLMQALFFSVVFGLIYLGVGWDRKDIPSIQNIGGVLYVFLTNVTFSNMFPVVTTFSAVMPLFLREHWNGLYRTDVYFITRNLAEIPIYIVGPAGFIAIAYFMVGLRDDAGSFFLAIFVIVLVANVAVSYGYMISCMAKNYQTALVLSTPLTFPLLLFGGYYMKPGTVPVYLEWMSYLSWFHFSFEALAINEWSGNDVCNDTASGDCVPIISGDDIIMNMGFSPDNFWVDVGALIGLLVGYRILAFLLLLTKTIR